LPSVHSTVADSIARVEQRFLASAGGAQAIGILLAEERRRRTRIAEQVPAQIERPVVDGIRFGFHWDGAAGDEDAIVQIIGVGPVETQRHHANDTDWVKVK